MKVIELFCGTKSFAKVAKTHGHEIFTVDIDPQFAPDIVADVSKLKIEDFPEEWRHPDVIWASIPCTCFSVASIGTHWDGGKKAYIPKTEEAKQSIKLVKHTVELIKELDPTFVFIENPRGILRKLVLIPYPYKTPWYCQYSDERTKPTDIWTNLDNWQPKTCHNGSKDHAEARRGAKTGTQGRKGAKIEQLFLKNYARN